MPSPPSTTYERLGQSIADRKRTVGKVLNGNGITRYGNGDYSLIGGDELSDRGSVSGRGWGSGVIKGMQSY
jgi:hypothetical protein